MGELAVPGKKLEASDPVIQMMGVAFLAWGCAKFNAIRTSTEKEFSQVNLLPMLALIGTTVKNFGFDPVGSSTQLLFAAGYTFFGFLKKQEFPRGNVVRRGMSTARHTRATVNRALLRGSGSLRPK